MSSLRWLRVFPNRFFARPGRRASSSRSDVSSRLWLRPSLEILEDRTVPAVFDVGPGDVATLIADINTANSNGQGNFINLSPSTYNLIAPNNDWYGPNGLPAITSNLTINGNGATINRVTTALPFRLFYVSGGLELPAGQLTMNNVTLQGGVAKGGESNEGGGGLGAGGAIFNQGTLNLTAVTLTDNEALGGSTGISTDGNGGGGMGQDAPTTNNGGGFGIGYNGSYGGGGGTPGTNSGGGGGGFLAGANGQNGTGSVGGSGGGLGNFSSNFNGVVSTSSGDGGAGGSGGTSDGQGYGGEFGHGGAVSSTQGSGGGGGVGGGGGYGIANGGSGGFGGGGGHADLVNDGSGGFGGGNGNGDGGAGMGGAVFNMGANSADPGSGQANLVNCTLTGNIAQGGNAGAVDTGLTSGSGFGGALFNLDGGVTLANDTLAANFVSSGSLAEPGTHGSASGGAVYNLAFGNDIDTGNPVTAILALNNSILATSNAVDLVSSSVNGSGSNTAIVAGGNNLVMSYTGTVDTGVIKLTANPNLGPLQNNGGLMPTMLPQSGSPVLGAGNPSAAPSTDQRGVERPPNGPIDLGSVQVSVPPLPSPSLAPSPPPSLFQAILGLYIDGIELEAVEQGNLAGFNDDFGTASLLRSVLEFFGNPSLDAIQANIAFNEPFAGPFGPFVVQVAELALLQALQSS